METSKQGISLIKYFESLHDGDLRKIGLQPKMCPAGIWTVGYGRALRDLDGSYLKGVNGYRRMLEIYPDLETLTEEESVDLLKEDLKIRESMVNSLRLPLKQYEFAALVSFTYNVGFANLRSSTLLKRIKGANGSIYDAFMMWVKADGKVLNGLVKRRRTEANLFLNGELTY